VSECEPAACSTAKLGISWCSRGRLRIEPSIRKQQGAETLRLTDRDHVEVWTEFCLQEADLLCLEAFGSTDQHDPRAARLLAMAADMREEVQRFLGLAAARIGSTDGCQAEVLCLDDDRRTPWSGRQEEVDSEARMW